MNAASVAEERGIRVTERKQARDAGAAAVNVLRMTFKSGQQATQWPVRPAQRPPRLLEIDGIRWKRRWRATSFTCATLMCPE